MLTSQQAPLQTTFLTSQACTAVSIDTCNAPARFIGHLCWDTHKRVYVQVLTHTVIPIPIEIRTLGHGYRFGLDDDGEVTTIAPNLSKYMIFVSPLFFTIERFLQYHPIIYIYILPKSLWLLYYPN